MSVDEHVEAVCSGYFAHSCCSEECAGVVGDSDFPVIDSEGGEFGQFSSDFWPVHVSAHCKDRCELFEFVDD